MKRKITRKYFQRKDAYLDGFEEGFQRAYHLGEISKQVEYGGGYNDALKDMHEYLMDTYQTEFDWDDINRAIESLENTNSKGGRMTEEIQKLRKEFIEKFGNADLFDDLYSRLCRKYAEEVDKWLCRKEEE